MAVDSNWFQLLQSFGIISSSMLATYAAVKNVRATKLSNYMRLTESHRDIWRMTMDPALALDRIRLLDPALQGERLTNIESQFLTFLFLHITTTFELQKTNNLVNIQRLRADIRDTLRLPLIRRFWEENKQYYNDDFVAFIDGAARGLSGAHNARALLISARPNLVREVIAQDTALECLAGDTPRGTVLDAIRSQKPGFVITFGCDTILPMIDLRDVVAINLHTSLLPDCRGSMPHLWTFIDGVRPGVSVHQIDSGIDTGPLVAQEEVEVTAEGHTLQSVFELLHARVALLFARVWPQVRSRTFTPVPQQKGGSYHTVAMLETVQPFLEENVNAPLPWLIAQLKQRDPRLDLRLN